jgi:hypothetical protein
LVSKVTAIYMKKLQPCKLLLIPFQQELWVVHQNTDLIDWEYENQS